MKKDLGITVLLLILCGIAAYMNPRFLSAYNLQNNARLIGMYGIFSIGLGIVIITGGIDLSIGSVFALQGVLLATLLRGGALYLWPEMRFGDHVLHTVIWNVGEMPWQFGVLAAMAVVLFLGLVHAVLIVRFKMQPFIVTLCGLLLYRGVARFMANDETRGFGESSYGYLRAIVTGNIHGNMPFTIPMPLLVIAALIAIWLVIPGLIYGRYLFFLGKEDGLAQIGPFEILRIIGSVILSLIFSYGSYHILTTNFPYGIGGEFAIPMPFVILVIISLVFSVVIHKSIYGRYLFAVGRNEEAARYSGINSKLIIGSAYVLCMLLGGIAGIILALDTNSISASDFGLSYELYGIAAAVLGGCSLRGGEGSVLGIVIGTALLQVLQNIVNLVGIPSSLNGVVMGAVILVGVLVDQILAQRRKRKIVVPGAPQQAAVVAASNNG